jgi:hypothetical protein
MKKISTVELAYFSDCRITATWQREFCPLPKHTDGI